MIFVEEMSDAYVEALKKEYPNLPSDKAEKMAKYLLQRAEACGLSILMDEQGIAFVQEPDDDAMSYLLGNVINLLHEGKDDDPEWEEDMEEENDPEWEDCEEEE